MPYPRDTSKWTVMIDNKLTFCGALYKYFDIIADEHNLKQDTRNNYAGEYERHILPRLQNRPLEEYTAEDFEAVILDIASEGDGCAESTLQRYRMHIKRVIDMAVQHEGMHDPLWGVVFEEVIKPKQVGQRERRTLPKSFTAKQQCAIGDAIYQSGSECGDNVGLMLSYEAGLRPKESAGVTYGDLWESDDYGVLAIHTSTQGQGNKRHGKLKTKNGYRMAVLSRRAVDIINNIKDEMCGLLDREKGNSVAIMTASIAGKKDDPFQPQSSTQLSKAFRTVLHDIGYDAEDFMAAARVVESDEYADAVRRVTPGELGFADERNPTMYIQRRQFCTDMHIMECDVNQIQYAMGHRIENTAIDRRDYRNKDKLKELAEKLNRRPSVNREVLNQEYYTFSGTQLNINDFHDTRIRVPMRKGKIIIRVSSHEPLTPASIEIFVPQNVHAISCKYYVREDTSPQNKGVNVLNDYYDDFRKAYKELDEKQKSKSGCEECMDKSPSEIE